MHSSRSQKKKMFFFLFKFTNLFVCLIVAPWKFDVFTSKAFALYASLVGQIFVLRTSSKCSL